MKILILITAFNVNKFLSNVINRIPRDIFKKNNIEILIIDDKSTDNTLKKMFEIKTR